MEAQYILALDQGTTSSRAVLFDGDGRPVHTESQPLTQIYPQAGWVEHDPNEIWTSQLSVAQRVLSEAQIEARHIAAIGITNQRETTIIWDRSTGKPIYHAIVWQCRRSASLCDEIKNSGFDQRIREKTGLVTDAYFSATKVKWILDNVPEAHQKAEAGDLMFGTVDSWLIYKLTGGRAHITDASNASRTLLFNIHQRQWDEDILDHLGIPASLLPRVSASSEVYAEADPTLFGVSIPIAGCAGDQQAALFGQTCFQPGQAKNTYGTGCFLLMNTGTKPVASRTGLLTTIGWMITGEVEYALEGSVFIAGAAIQWLRDQLGLVTESSETDALARLVSDNGGVYFVPAFVGMGAPYWDMYARGALFGLTRGTRREHLIRAALEAMAYQSRDVLGCLQQDAGVDVKLLRVDGGAATNDFLCQFQADILGLPVERAAVKETTALGAAYLAGLATGFWESREQIAAGWQVDRRFEPKMSSPERERLYNGWQEAVRRSLGWANKGET
jgi:glycerol kinase